ncbi:hypothetical protein HMPREF1986_01703 [Oribacterium sp. oral taxon 078 str. F0263]|nr:hypothetical protein HMPREF1986_01703 [Oribacterium sp. oral taxon 078 str. F0263]
MKVLKGRNPARFPRKRCADAPSPGEAFFIISPRQISECPLI